MSMNAYSREYLRIRNLYLVIRQFQIQMLLFSVVRPTVLRPTVNMSHEPPPDQQQKRNPTTDKWAGTLRRQDADIPRTLPSIITRKSVSTTSSLGSGRRARSRDRLSRRRLAPVKLMRRPDGENDAGDGVLERNEKVFDTSGYELHLVETLERDILQKNPDVRWKDVIGLDDAKSVLQEAVVLPLVMPDYFKV